MKNQPKAYVFAGLTILCWSTVATAFKFGLRYQDPFSLLAGAALTAFLILLFTIVVQKKTGQLRKTSLREYGTSAALGFLNPFFYYLVLFKAYSMLPAQVAQPLNMTWPIVLTIISIPLLNQKITITSIAALFISFSGVILISSQGGGTAFKVTQISGILLCLGSAVIWSFFWIFNVRDKRDEIVKLFLNFAFALLFLVLAALATGKNFPSGFHAWIWAVWVGVFEMGLAFIFWLKALQLTKTTDKISNLIYISPFISLFFIHYFLGEPIYLTTV
ncbi:MAG TPA: DMT family transporter, partial [Bacteroidales bacterium]|nr:DMT family transporter [Bacteroidales bacterium]